MTVLMPLTIDRVLVIMFPFMHRKWMSHKIIFLMVGFWWLPSVSFTLYHLAQYQRGLAKVGRLEISLYCMFSACLLIEENPK